MIKTKLNEFINEGNDVKTCTYLFWSFSLNNMVVKNRLLSEFPNQRMKCHQTFMFLCFCSAVTCRSLSLPRVPPLHQHLGPLPNGTMRPARMRPPELRMPETSNESTSTWRPSTPAAYLLALPRPMPREAGPNPTGRVQPNRGCQTASCVRTEGRQLHLQTLCSPSPLHPPLLLPPLVNPMSLLLPL